MAATLDKPELKAAIKAAMLVNILDPTPQQTTEVDTLAGAIADAVDTFVKSGTVEVTVPFPIPVTVAIPAGTGGTTSTATATGAIS